jgi:hypothetical protein
MECGKYGKDSHTAGYLRRRSTAALPLRSGVQIAPGAWMLVCCVCCVLSGRVSATSLSLVQRSPTVCGASLCVIKKPCGRGGHSPRWAAVQEKIKYRCVYVKT